MLEQELASIIKYVLDKTGNPAPYYWKVPQNFSVPAAYFPEPEIVSGGETFLTYRLEFTWFIKFFHATDNGAYNLGLQALTAIRGGRNLIPLIDEAGEEIRRQWLRIADPSIRIVDNGVCQMQIEWISRRPYYTEQVQKMMRYEVEGWRHPDQYIQRTITAACAEALSRYAVDYPTPAYAGQQPKTAE